MILLQYPQKWTDNVSTFYLYIDNFSFLFPFPLFHLFMWLREAVAGGGECVRNKYEHIIGLVEGREASESSWEK